MNETATHYELTVRAEFDASHYLPKHEGKCANLHGHTWTVEASILGEKLNDQGMVVDFGDVKAILRQFDHHHINDILPIPTAENIAQHMHGGLCGLLGCSGDRVRVTLAESSTSSVTVVGDQPTLRMPIVEAGITQELYDQGWRLERSGEPAEGQEWSRSWPEREEEDTDE